MKVSYYRNLYDKKPVDVNFSSIVQAIQKGKFKSLINEIRLETDKKKRNELKKKLPCFTASATMQSGRSNSAVKEHSGIIQIDIDNIPNPFYLLLNLELDEHTFSSFLSPSGNGAKVFFKIEPDTKKHLQYFTEIEEYFIQRYNVQIDKSCKDVARICFVSFDDLLYYNKDCKQFEMTHKIPLTTEQNLFKGVEKPHTKKTFIKLTESELTAQRVETIISRAEKNGIDFTGNYQNHLKLAFALCNEFGSNTAYNMFARIKRIGGNFNEKETKVQFEAIAKKVPKTSIKTFFGIASDYGLTFM